MDNYDKFLNSISNYDRYCDGYSNPSGKGNYILGFILEVGKVDIQFSHSGSRMLDEINAFDMAERNGTYVGQINMSIVSSFCGPQGLIWGYDIAKSDWVKESRIDHKLFVESNGKRVDIYSLRPMLEATKELFGSVDSKKFPLIPGAHVPCAGKNIKTEGPARVYTAVAVGVSKNRDQDACLLMEDIGEIPVSLSGQELEDYRLMIIKKIAQSVVQIGENQGCEYERVFVGMTDEFADEGEIACALVAAPYFTLAKDAAKPFIEKGSLEVTLADWKSSVM